MENHSEAPSSSQQIRVSGTVEYVMRQFDLKEEHIASVEVDPNAVPVGLFIYLTPSGRDHLEAQGVSIDEDNRLVIGLPNYHNEEVMEGLPEDAILTDISIFQLDSETEPGRYRDMDEQEQYERFFNSGVWLGITMGIVLPQEEAMQMREQAKRDLGGDGMVLPPTDLAHRMEHIVVHGERREMS